MGLNFFRDRALFTINGKGLTYLLFFRLCGLLTLVIRVHETGYCKACHQAEEAGKCILDLVAGLYNPGGRRRYSAHIAY